MGWIYKPEPKHECGFPDEAVIDGIWECDDCNRRYWFNQGFYVPVPRDGLRQIACGGGICCLGLGHTGRCIAWARKLKTA